MTLISFFYFRPLRLHLHCQRGLFTSDFVAVVVDARQNEEVIHIDKNHYEGFVEGEETTWN